jgi:putative two-component system response regulator
MMPGKSGIQLLKEIRNEHPNIATVMISGQGNQDIANKVILMGAYDYIYKPFQKKQVLVSVSNALRRKALDIQNGFQLEQLETIIKNQTIDVSVANNKLSRAIESIVEAMSMAIESRDPYTAGHQNRVANIAGAIAAKMEFSKERIHYLRMAAIVHDIGKISVPAEILNKPGKLSAAEFNIIKEHPTTGYNILKGIDFHYPLAEIVYQHHERIDGSGYPRQLKANAIHMEAKIIAVADVLEAMASHRPYRPALGIDIALDEIIKNRGRGFDPDIADVCCSLFKYN